MHPIYDRAKALTSRNVLRPHSHAMRVRLSLIAHPLYRTTAVIRYGNHFDTVDQPARKTTA
ncbi:MAG TPA: hypothetical protein VL967_02495 [Terracidiphilus sp.]|nr:hypothetical protein [Terracidiphilus sp.]